ncbi:MFS transporter, partial [Actinomadura adrarensis]
MVEAGGRGDYARMALMLSIAMAVTGAIAILGVRDLTRHAGFRMPDQKDHSFIEDVRVSMRDRDFRMLVLSYLFTSTVTHLFLAALPFYTEYVFEDAGLTTVLMGAFLGPAVIAGPAWMRISRRTGKQKGLLTCQAIFIVGSLAFLLGETLGVPATIAVTVMLGIAFAGLQLFAFSMLPDAVAAAGAR